MEPILIQDYTYDLPEEKIALRPVSPRDQSRLLVYKKGNISHKNFSDIPDSLPDHSLLIFNDTRVIPARILFEKETGAVIEVFLLNPVSPSDILSIALDCRNKVTWKCAIGNLKRWSAGLVLNRPSGPHMLNAHLISREEGLVEFTWEPSDLSFAEIIHQSGAIPLPPYIHRKIEKGDESSYQTVYSHHEGAVAAPTAGLHFTENVMEQLKARGIKTDFLTLHVSAGTFMPVKVGNVLDHKMHQEQVVVRKETLLRLLEPGNQIIAVGTTSMRTLESLYWYGADLVKNPDAPFLIEPLQPYRNDRELPSLIESITAILKHMQNSDLEEIKGFTSIFIFPGYTFRVCRGLITNFHQPQSTLLLLIAAWIGPDWKRVYDEALANNYRFLSYGDSSLLLPS